MSTLTATANESTIDVLNDLIAIHNDRITGYRNAIEELKGEDTDLQPLFADMIAESEGLKRELSFEVQSLGGQTETGTTASGKIYRAWMDVKAVFTGHTRHAILASCEGGEDAAQKAYRSALEEEDVSMSVRSRLTTQQQQLKLSHDKIKRLRDQSA